MQISIVFIRKLPFFLSLLLVLSAAVLTLQAEPCNCETTPVYQAAGQGAERLDPGREITVQGVVTAAFLGDCGLDGFFIQGKKNAPDDLPSGLFIYAPGLKKQEKKAVQKGRELRILGKTGIYRGRPQLEEISSISIQGSRKTEAVKVKMPLSNPRRLEGVKVTFQHGFTVTDNYQLRKYGSLELCAMRRAFQPSNFFPGDGPKNPECKEKRIILDDGCYRRNPDSIPYLNTRNTRRVGTRVKKGLTGILTHSFDSWRIHPTKDPEFINTNPRPEELPKPDSDNVRLAVLNMHSYFLTLGERGAKNRQELGRQQNKLLAAVENLHPDILLLLEMENKDKVPGNFLQHLKKKSGKPWRLVRSENAEDNVIRISMAYRSDRIEQTQSGKRDFSSVHGRPPLIAAFKPRKGKEQFAVAGAHFKSKSDCPKNGDTDTGQGCWNQKRAEQARALLEFIQNWREEHNTVPALIAGDLNAYGAEDPVQVLTQNNRKDLLAEYVPWEKRYTYIYSGQSGYLDHLIAYPGLAGKISDVYTYPINADEPRFLEYNKKGPENPYPDNSPYRCSDHDPLAVDLLVR
ncbi:MAG: ExeM/NucH family extracellular endonuclease [Thermodesulfobacteriota bacterium]